MFVGRLPPSSHGSPAAGPTAAYNGSLDYVGLVTRSRSRPTPLPDKVNRLATTAARSPRPSHGGPSLHVARQNQRSLTVKQAVEFPMGLSFRCSVTKEASSRDPGIRDQRRSNPEAVARRMSGLKERRDHKRLRRLPWPAAAELKPSVVARRPRHLACSSTSRRIL